MIKKVFDLVAMPLAVAGFGLLLLAEKKWPLRKPTISKLQRLKSNLALSALTAVAIRLAFLPAITAVAGRVEEKKIGLLNLLPLPGPVKLVAALLLLDYTFYWWHRLLHERDFLWRFHAVHHADLDLDVSTAARFHFGEWVVSTAYRAGQLILIGAGPMAEAIFETVMVIATEFHHSNARLPLGVERRLNFFFVTPRMHGIHHSIVEQETDSNFATLLTVWDRLHGTLKLNVPQAQITIGLPMYRDERELTFWRLVAEPFRKQKDLWLLPDGSTPTRKQLAAASTRMLD